MAGRGWKVSSQSCVRVTSLVASLEAKGMAGVVNTVVGSSADGLLDSVDSGVGFIKGRRLIRREHLRRAGEGMKLSEARQNNFLD